MPLLQGQPFRLIKPPENVPPGTELYTIQHTGEKFINKSDYEDRLALYSQSIWMCQCSGKSGMTHQEAWTSESKVRVQLSSSFPVPLWAPILRYIHHCTQPLDQLVENTSTLCLSKFHPGEELTLLNPQTQVRVISSREAPATSDVKNGTSLDPSKAGNGEPGSPPPTVPLTNGCASSNRDGTSVNGASNGSSAASDEGSPPSSTKSKEDSPSRKKSLLPLLYDVEVIGEDRKVKDVPARDLQRTHKIPPKEHFRLFIRANALRHRASAFTPWIVSEDLVKQYNIPSKLASVFTQAGFNIQNKKRKLDQPTEKAKKPKGETQKKPKEETEKKIKKEPGDAQVVKKKPGPKPGFKRAPKIMKTESGAVPVKEEKLVKVETSDSDDDIALSVLANKSPSKEGGSHETSKEHKKVDPSQAVKSESKHDNANKQVKLATLFDMKPKTQGTKTPLKPASPRKSPKKAITAASVMEMPVMRSLVHNLKLYKGVRGKGRKIVFIMDQALNRLSLKHLAVIPDLELQKELMRRREKVMEKRVLSTLSAADKEAYFKQKALDERKKKKEDRVEENIRLQEQNRKLEDRIVTNLKPLPPPKLVPTPEEIPNSLFGDITMIVEFIESYRDIVLTDKKSSISCQHLMQALAAGKEGFKFLSEIMVLLLHILIDDERIGDNKELGFKISELAVHYQTAIELARLCLSKRDSSDSASQHSDDNEFEEECELSDGLLKKLDTHEMYELQPDEIIEVLKALCHRAMSAYTSMEFFEDIEEKWVQLHRQHLKLKKENLKEELQKKKEKREQKLQKKKEKQKSPKKSPGRPKKVNTLESFVKKDESPDIVSIVKKRKRMSQQDLQREKEEQSKELRERKLKEEEENRKANIVIQWEKINVQKDLLLRLQPVGVDRNHDRYWLFNHTTPGLYVEKGWVDVNTTYCVKAQTPRKSTGSVTDSPLVHDAHLPKSPTSGKPPKSVVQKISFSTPEKTKPVSSALTVSVTESLVSHSLTIVSTCSSTMVNSSTLVNSTVSVVSSTISTVSVTSPLSVSSGIEKKSDICSSETKTVDSGSVVCTPTVSCVVAPTSNAMKASSAEHVTVTEPKTSLKKSVLENNTSMVADNAISVSATQNVPVSTSHTSTSSVVPSSTTTSSVTLAPGKGSMSEDATTSPSSSSMQKITAISTDSSTTKVPSNDVVANASMSVDINDMSKKSEAEARTGDLASKGEISAATHLSSQQSSQATPGSQKSVTFLQDDSDSDEKPLAAVKKQLDLEAEDKPLSVIKKELLDKTPSPKKDTDSPTKAKGRGRGRPPKPKSDTPPRPRGRPPKEKTPGEVKSPRPRGRPPKPKTPDGSPTKNPDGTPSKSPGRPRGRPKVNRSISDEETFPPVGQNMWFYYHTLEQVDRLIESLTVRGVRESKLKTSLTKIRPQLEINFSKSWKPLEDFVDGSVQLVETLREDVIQIEKELTEGWLGSVPEPEEWDKKASEASTVQELGECLIEAQQHMQIKFLKGIMKPVRKVIPSDNPEAPPEFEEIEGSAVKQWRKAVRSCSTFSRLHLLVGMFDSCIKWEKSMATRKCKVCRAQDTSVPLAVCDKCEGSYHWACMRPQLFEEPPEPWLCPACLPNKNKERRKITRNQVEEVREETPAGELKQEKICRVCVRGIGLIFCSTCPAAYHSECHNPPLQTRARKDWKCVDCEKPKSRSKRSSLATKYQPAKTETRGKGRNTVTSRRSSRRQTYAEEDEGEEEEEEAEEESSENEDSDEDFTTRRKSKRSRKTVMPARRTTKRTVKKKSYKIESEEEEEESEEAEESEEEVEEGDEQQEDEEEQQEDEEEQQEDEEEQQEDEEEQQEDEEEGDEQQEDEEEQQEDEEEEQEDEDQEDKDEEEEEDDEDDQQEDDEDQQEDEEDQEEDAEEGDNEDEDQGDDKEDEEEEDDGDEDEGSDNDGADSEED